jgi:mannose-6-phosphate isomerase
VAPGVSTWPVPVRDFALHRVAVSGGPVELPVAGPRIVLGVEGAVTVGEGPEVTAGSAAFAAATEGPLVFAGDGVVFVASVAV